MTSRERLKAAIEALVAKHQTRTMNPSYQSPIMPTSSMQPTAVANALKGEKSFETVEFAITGNREIDAIVGIRAVLERIGNDYAAAARVLSYHLQYARDGMAAEERQREAMGWQYAAPGINKFPPGMVSGLVTAAQSIGASPYPAHSPKSMVMDDAAFVSMARDLGLGKEP